MALFVLALPLLFSRLTPAETQNDPSQNPVAPPPRVKDMGATPAITLPPPPVSPGVKSPISASSPLTPDEAASIALVNQPAIAAAQGNVANAKGRTNQVRAGLLPSVVAGAGYDNLQSLSGEGVKPTQLPTVTPPAFVSPVDIASGAVQIRQLLFDFNQTRNLVRQSKELEHVAESNLTATQETVVFNVKTAYYALVSAQEAVRVSTENLDNRQRQLDLAKSRLDHGVGLPSDLVSAETFKSQAILGLNQADDAEAQSRVNLLTLMGVNPLTPIVIDGAHEEPADIGDVRHLLLEAFAKRPEIKSARSQVSASRFGLSAARALNLPSAYAALGAGSRGNNFPLDDSTLSLQIGLQVPLYDGGQRNGAIEQSRGALTTAEAQLQSTLDTVSSDVVTAYLAEKSAEQRIDITTNEVANASEGVRIAEGRYKAGLGLFLDITTAQASLLVALEDQIAARSSLDAARTRVRFATGNSLSSMR